MSTSKAKVFAKYYNSLIKFSQFKTSDEKKQFLALMKNFKPFIDDNEWEVFFEGICMGDPDDINIFLTFLAEMKNEMEQERTAVNVTEKDDDDGGTGMDLDVGEILEPENDADRAFTVPDDVVEYDTPAAKEKAKRRRLKRASENHLAVYHELQKADDEEDEKTIAQAISFKPAAQARARTTTSSSAVASLQPVVVAEPKPASLKQVTVAADFTQEPTIQTEYASVQEMMDDNDGNNTDDDLKSNDGDDEAEGELKQPSSSRKRKAGAGESALEKRIYQFGESFVLKNKTYEVKYVSPYTVPVHVCDDGSIDILWEDVIPDMVSNLWGCPLNKTDLDYVSCLMTEQGGPVLIPHEKAKMIEGKTKAKVSSNGKSNTAGKHPLMNIAMKTGNLQKLADGQIKTYMCHNYFKNLAKNRVVGPAPSVIKTNPEAKQLLQTLRSSTFNELSDKFVIAFIEGCKNAPTPHLMIQNLKECMKAIEQDIKASLTFDKPIFQVFTDKYNVLGEAKYTERDRLKFFLWNMVLIHPALKLQIEKYLETMC
jgi:hypothetical protein